MKMKNQKVQVVISSLLCLGMLSACSQGGGGGATNDSTSSASQAQPTSASQQMLNDVGTTLRAKSASAGVPLSEAQIIALLLSGQSALSSANLLGSGNFSAIIPVLIQGLTQGVGGLNITNPTQISSLLSLIGNGTLNSLLGSGSPTSSNLISMITNSLFKNLPLAGATSGNLSTIMNQLMSSFIGQVGQNNNWSSGNFSTIIQSLLSGAMSGVGGLPNFGSLDLNTILQQISSGAVGGLSGIALPGGLNSTNLQTLLSAIMSGSQSGLLQMIGANAGAGLNLNTLLQSVLQGQMNGVSTLPVTSSIEQTLISYLLSMLV